MIYEFCSHEQPNTKSTKQMLCPQDELGESTLKEKRAEAAGGVFSTRGGRRASQRPALALGPLPFSVLQGLVRVSE